MMPGTGSVFTFIVNIRVLHRKLRYPIATIHAQMTSKSETFFGLRNHGINLWEARSSNTIEWQRLSKHKKVHTCESFQIVGTTNISHTTRPAKEGTLLGRIGFPESSFAGSIVSAQRILAMSMNSELFATCLSTVSLGSRFIVDTN